MIKEKRIKSESGFTMQDLIVAIFFVTLFVAVISSLMYSVFKVNTETQFMTLASVYSIQILEDIDKISYDEVDPSLADEYVTTFQIPSQFDVQIEVNKYGEEQNLEDLIKIVKLTISYTYSGNTQNITYTRLKIKEI